MKEAAVRNSVGLQIRVVLRLILLIFILPTVGSALTYGTPDSGFCHNMVSFLRIYESQNEGRPPTTWTELDQTLSQPIDEIYYYLQPTKRYAFLSKPVVLLKPLEGKLVVMTRRPYRDTELYSGWFGINRRLDKSGYRIIYKTPDGDFFKQNLLRKTIFKRFFVGRNYYYPNPTMNLSVLECETPVCM